ncbi:hypothetical protein V6N12_022372 [Hibiscus sabdariffa]|uniref:Uncharacterized protein n=1 Tax=Hibiscus sabdariffa TaxID=183260 RepID=A0ABR2FUH9_9ROSI
MCVSCLDECWQMFLELRAPPEQRAQLWLEASVAVATTSTSYFSSLFLLIYTMELNCSAYGTQATVLQAAARVLKCQRSYKLLSIFIGLVRFYPANRLSRRNPILYLTI